MKRLFNILIFVLAALCASAQDHLSFKGIPIEGSMSSFCRQLKDKGFAAKGHQNNISIFTGVFTGREATVGVVPDSDGKNVYGVVVLFPESDEWKTLLNTYNYYKEIYTRKYGKPGKCVEVNEHKEFPNSLIFYNLHQGKIDYACEWQAPGGLIKLTIDKTDNRDFGQVKIHYRDALNTEAKIQQDLDEI